MKKRILILLFSFFVFCVPCFAFDFPSTSCDHSHKYYHYETFKDGSSVIYFFDFDNIDFYFDDGRSGYCFNLDSCCRYSYPFSIYEGYWSVTNSTTHALKNGFIGFATNHSSLANYITSNSSAKDLGGSNVPVIPPGIAPNVGDSLKTENVLSAILPIVPIILVFLVAYWSFYKGYGILLKALGKA